MEYPVLDGMSQSNPSNHSSGNPEKWYSRKNLRVNGNEGHQEKSTYQTQQDWYKWTQIVGIPTKSETDGVSVLRGVGTRTHPKKSYILLFLVIYFLLDFCVF